MLLFVNSFLIYKVHSESFFVNVFLYFPLFIFFVNDKRGSSRKYLVKTLSPSLVKFYNNFIKENHFYYLKFLILCKTFNNVLKMNLINLDRT